MMDQINLKCIKINAVQAGGFSALSAYCGWTIAANALTSINDDLGPNDDILWLPLAYTLTQAIGNILIGRLSDIFGRRWFLIIGNSTVLVGTIVAATAQSIKALIASNVLIGIGSATQFSYYIFLPELVPYRLRGYVLVWCFISSIPGSAFGSVIAQSLVAHAPGGWRWCYYLNIISTSMTILLLVLFYHPPTYAMLHVGRPVWQKVKAIDYGGILLLTVGITLILLGVHWGGQTFPWDSAHVIATIIAGFATLVIFVVYEKYAPIDSIVPFALLRNVAFMMYVILAVVGGMIYYSMTVLWVQIVTTLFTSDPVYGGWLACSIAAPFTLGCIACNITFGTIGRVRYQFMTSITMTTAFIGAMASTTQYTVTRTIILSVIGAFACGFTEGLVNTVVPFTLPPEDIGIAVGMVSGMRLTFGSIATAMYSSILSNKSATLRVKLIPAAALAAGLPNSSIPSLMQAIANGTSAALASVPDINSQIEIAVGLAQKTAFSGAVRLVFLVSVAFGGIGIIATFFLKNIDHLLTNDVSRKLHTTQGTETISDKEPTSEHVA
jgi:MFS family permease